MEPLPPTPLLELIRQRIRQHGPMDLGEYMALCLGHPKHGYYMTRDPFGQAGDFVTAPEVSQLFGEMIGAWLADLWIKMGRPSDFILLECGPGRGTLMADILRATAKVPGFVPAAHVHLMEMSPVLRHLQKDRLEGYDPVWIDDLSQLPSSIPVLLVGNEFLDALPIRQLCFEKGGWQEIVVGLVRDDTLCFGKKQADLSLIEQLSPCPDVAVDGDVREVSPILNQFIKSVDILLKKQSGAALFLDYGYMRSAPGNTLQAMRSHRFVDVFDTPGLCDLTAHVDFENVGRIAEKDGMAVFGPVTQGAFLQALGISLRCDRLMERASEAQRDDLRRGLERLVAPDQMGDLFKVMALCHDASLQPAGF